VKSNHGEERTEAGGDEITASWVIAAAVASGVLYIGGGIALGTPPTTAETGTQVAQWFEQNQAGARWYAWAMTANVPLLGFLFAWLRRQLPPLSRDMFFLGATMLFVTTAVQAWTWGGLAAHADHLDAAVARSVLDVGLYWGPVLTGGTITMMFPVTRLALTGRAGLPRWLGIFGVVAIVEQAAETVTIFGSTGFTAPGGAMNLQLGAGLVGLWMAAFTVWSALASRTPSSSYR